MFGRLFNLFRGFLSLFISGIERQNPEALLESEKERFREMVSKYNTALAPQAGVVERLKRLIFQGEREEKDLKSKVTANLQAGNKGIAAQLALDYARVKQSLTDNKSQFDEAEKTYQNLIRARDVAVKEAQTKIQSIASGIGKMKMNQATAELQEMASTMIGQLGGGGESLNRLEEMVNDESEKAAGRARVAKDSIDTTHVEMKESELNALANQALAEFAAEQGIVLESDSSLVDKKDSMISSVLENTEASVKKVMG